MKTITYTTKDKTAWGPGPWQTEPDKVQFEDPDTGLPCLIVRTDMGILCGYVGVPESHPLFGKNYAEIDDVSVHGGLTFSGHSRPDDSEDSGICHLPDIGESDKVWWLGFDCAHAGDLLPHMHVLAKNLFRSFHRNDQYRDMAFVKSQIEILAAQLKATYS